MSCVVRLTVMLFTFVLLASSIALLIYNFNGGTLPPAIDLPELPGLPSNPNQSAISTPVLLADKTKFGKIAPVKVPNGERAAYVLVDEDPGKAIADTARESGVELRIVK